MKNRIKTGGRNKGTPNLITKEVKTLLKSFILNELKTIQEQVDKLDTKDKLEIIVKILPFVVPKCYEIDAEINSNFKPNTYVFPDGTRIE